MTVSPAQIEFTAEICGVGNAETVTGTDLVAVHPPTVTTVTVYVVFVVGLTVVEAIDPPLLQLYETAFGHEAVNVVLPPAHTLVLPVTVITG